jgi:hypothetical protein
MLVITDINYFANGFHLRPGTEDSCVRSKLDTPKIRFQDRVNRILLQNGKEAMSCGKINQQAQYKKYVCNTSTTYPNWSRRS